MTTVAIIGAGPLGRWLALAAARAGFRVFLEDVMPSNLHHAQEYLRQQLSPERLHPEDLVDAASVQRAGGAAFVNPAFQRGEADSIHKASPVGTMPSDSPNELLKKDEAHVHFVSTVEDAVREADLVIDCVPDELESKLEILWLLDRMAPPKTVIATPTTNLSIIDLGACTYRPEKCIAIAADPRSLSAQEPGTAIRLTTTPRTTAEAAALVHSFWQSLGFHPSLGSIAE